MAGADALMKNQNSPIFRGKSAIASASEYVKSVK